MNARGDPADLLGAHADLPPGFLYRPDFVTEAEEQQLAAHIAGLPLAEFQYYGFTGKRRVLNCGWDYSFGSREFARTDPIPDFLLPLRARAAELAGFEPAAFEQALVTEYQPGAAIGWHRDVPMFGVVAGISLLGRCHFRLRRRDGKTWARASLRLEPRSVYLLDGPARTEWQHSIPPAESLRYSITFRTLRKAESRGGSRRRHLSCSS